MTRSFPIVALSDMTPDMEADIFVLMTAKEQLTTKTGSPYFKVGFRDAGREVSFPIWGDSPLAIDCRERWMPGQFYKIRAVYRETNYGPQLDIRRIREATDDDRPDGFDPSMCMARASRDPGEMFDTLIKLVKKQIKSKPLRSLVLHLLESNQDDWLVRPAAKYHHHAYQAGLLEHTLSVAETCVLLADRYETQYLELDPPLDRGMVIAGAVLHDIGKLRELSASPAEIRYTAEGVLIGHLLMGRDMIREASVDMPLDEETRLRLEHLVIAHQRLPEWGSPKPPMTPEALIVHYADDLDAKFRMMVDILIGEASQDQEYTSSKNVLRQHVFRGLD